MKLVTEHRCPEKYYIELSGSNEIEFHSLGELEMTISVDEFYGLCKEYIKEMFFSEKTCPTLRLRRELSFGLISISGVGNNKILLTCPHGDLMFYKSSWEYLVNNFIKIHDPELARYSSGEGIHPENT